MRSAGTLAPVTTYYWDYFGPDAEGTARHFLAHLREYLGRNGLGDCEVGVASERAGHGAAWCKAPEHAQAALLRLRPRRAVPAA